MISTECLPLPHFNQFSLLPDSQVIWSSHSICYLRATPCDCRKIAGAHKTDFIKVCCNPSNVQWYCYFFLWKPVLRRTFCMMQWVLYFWMSTTG